MGSWEVFIICALVSIGVLSECSQYSCFQLDNICNRPVPQLILSLIAQAVNKLLHNPNHLLWSTDHRTMPSLHMQYGFVPSSRDDSILPRRSNTLIKACSEIRLGNGNVRIDKICLVQETCPALLLWESRPNLILLLRCQIAKEERFGRLLQSDNPVL